jgi:hypothetical protein
MYYDPNYEQEAASTYIVLGAATSADESQQHSEPTTGELGWTELTHISAYFTYVFPSGHQVSPAARQQNR